MPASALAANARMLLGAACHPDPDALMASALALANAAPVAAFTALLPTRMEPS